MRLYGLLKRNTVSRSSVLLTLLLVIACGTAAEPVSEQPVPQAQAEPAAAGGEPAGAPIAQPTEAAQPAATGQVKVDRLVIVGEVQAYEATDPYAMPPSSLPQIHVMYENLLGVDRDTVAYTPMLAES
jgi:hypothetical protein